MPDTWYPPADNKIQRRDGANGSRDFSGITMKYVSKLVLHSTETAVFPGYPSFAPQLTYHPWTHEWRQHMSVNKSASTLADPSSTAVRENRDDVVQVEIVGYCDPVQIKKVGKDVQAIDDRAIADLAKFVAWLHTEWQLPLTAIATSKWLRYPNSYGNRNGQRLSGSQYDSFKGVLGHQHTSGNDHGDPGALPIAKIMAAAKKIVSPAPAAPSPVVPTPNPTTTKPTTVTPDPEVVAVVPGGKVYTAFGRKGSVWAAGYHTGDDWHTNSGEKDRGKDVNAPVSGKVIHAGNGGWGPAYGVHVILEDATGDETAVCHLQWEGVKVGDYVFYGDRIGKLGDTGNASGPHVHVERRHKVFGYWQHEKPRYGDVAPFPGTAAFKLGKSHPAVTLLDRRLIAHGFTSHNDGNGYQAGPTFTTHTRENVRDFQKAQGWSGSDADGYPGPSTWARLMASPK